MLHRNYSFQPSPHVMCVHRVLPRCIHFACSFLFLPKFETYKPFKCHLICRFVKVSSHGPAVKLLITNYRDGKKYCVDLVPAIKDNTWPGDAIEWIQRQRKSTRKRSLLFQSARPKGVKMDNNSSLVFLKFRRFYLVFMDN